ncbi:hypothetical protein HanLR1_Chr07g0238321 [Helianthus annuus]|nr:hypothetical protein HanLR1_Chr07g0238321 [Helianthus annuus]
MALREGKCFVRRVADRGIAKNIGDSRVRGDRLNYDHRSAGRGNEIRNRDPRDIIKIKRLRQRVQDLEEIKRLRQRVRDLELQWEMCKTETKSSTIVWDEGGDGEEHPFGHNPPRFYEPIYQESLSEEEPRFDEDGIKPNEEEYVFVQNVLNGTTVQEDEQVEAHGEEEDGKPLMANITEYAKTFAGIFDEFSRDETDNNGGCVVDIVGKVVAIGAHAAGDVGLETPLFPPIVVEGLNTLKDKVSLNFDISIIDEISRKNNNNIYVNMEEHQGYKGYGDNKKNITYKVEIHVRMKILCIIFKALAILIVAKI